MRDLPVGSLAPGAPLSPGDARAQSTTINYGLTLSELNQLNLPALHNLGFIGTGVLVCMLDDGFNYYRQHEATVNQVMISGGAGSHDFVRQILADTTGLPVVATQAKEPVLLGAAMLGSVAAGAFASVQSAMHSMSRVDRVYSPCGEPNAAMHARRYNAFKRLQAVAREIR